MFWEGTCECTRCNHRSHVVMEVGRFDAAPMDSECSECGHMAVRPLAVLKACYYWDCQCGHRSIVFREDKTISEADEYGMATHEVRAVHSGFVFCNKCETRFRVAT